MNRRRLVRLAAVLVSIAAWSVLPAGEESSGPEGRRGREGRGERPDRASAVRALCERLGVGPGASVADVGCGQGHDSMVLAEVVGATGAVFSEEINVENVKSVAAVSRERKLTQIVPVLGESIDPRLPNGRLDLIYMHLVFHHFSDPRDMLSSFRADLKPGGLLAISDRSRGPLRDRAPLEIREKEHHFTGETAVVRMALEAGLEFIDAPDDGWFEKEAFVLVFRRPAAEPSAGGGVASPAAPEPWQASDLVDAIGLRQDLPGDVLVVALDRGRSAVPALRAAAGPSRRIIDLVPEEWAIAADEVPEGCGAEGDLVLRTDGGSLKLPEGARLAAVVFADAYHRIWDPAPILASLRAALSPGARVVIADRTGPDGESRRLAGHRRRISPALVLEELGRAEFRALEAPADTHETWFLRAFEPAGGPAGEPGAEAETPGEPASERQF